MVPLLDEQFSVLAEVSRQGFVRLYQVEASGGQKGWLFWFEVHTPEARTAFHRYKNAIRRLETQGFLPEGVVVSANPGRYYAFWPERPKGLLKTRRLKPVLEILKPFGYSEADLELGEENGQVRVVRLFPQVGHPPSSPQTQTEAMPPPAHKGAQPPGARRRWIGWLPGLLMLALGSLALLEAAHRYLNPPEYVLPDLVGKTPRQALEAVRGFGLQVEFAEGSDPSLPEDRVLKQTPDPGTRVKPGRRLELVVNKPRLGNVPTVVGRSLEDARRALEAAGYRVAGVTRIASGDTADTVLASIPREGQPIRPGEGVRLLVSSGARSPIRETLVPDLSGLTEEQARYILAVAELQAQVTRVPSGAPEGRVIAQEPSPGATLARESVVQIIVATQPGANLPKTSPFPPPRLAAPPPPEPPPSPGSGTQTNPTPPGPAERRVVVSYTLPENLPNAVVVITVQDEVIVNTLFEGPVEQPWSFNQEVVVRGSAILRVVVNGQLAVESPL
ncbi:MAG: PASTA domain-containing protein [Meiothermus sp.]|uniref:PASTA domain-containing protein n=1 Tax=Meiothermus sp. TaxID=1955249 RepID=UPI0025E2B7BC|nr:PASTA domain-containing protein [Meiothermus sp.]MCS7057664.1 PASTA domain-containing protein [Meiothermus sp.]MDW8482430.1 PASTA domain-containing protein [Meiothermus sp.]